MTNYDRSSEGMEEDLEDQMDQMGQEVQEDQEDLEAQADPTQLYPNSPSNLPQM